ncbi:type II toxin-antitoxin system VapC family toxin [Mucilaginibacter sp. X4EP1]|uniref:type II toxin-antitoxin system VapC family toxin n=1 Tax=Mucilaginibacter sp. X4EP1 TaxID=2723092 RepID=UPI0021679375|nr:PIN domain-containing protein [Mucilaginibacter sp. X4EP1]MCS3812305.1 putative nucleic acid-binding protein [Mucilaginibacter sp. X4EP1]
MKSIFIDSDVLLDILLDRRPFYDWAMGVFLLVDEKKFLGYTSVHSLLNIHYLAKKRTGEKSARSSIKLLTSKLKIITEDISIVDKAIESDFSDFEDAVQYYAAMSVNADFIVTRNIKDYKQSTIPVLTAEQFLRTL